jgi:hypothetical protein
MTRQPFNHELRLEWALHHLQSLEAKVSRWVEKRPYRLWTKFDPKSGKNLIWAEVLEQPPAQLGLIIGDYLHNLRSALDNLAYELALAYYRGSLPSDIASGSGFPLFGDMQQFTDKGRDMIRGIHPDAKTIIEGLQPYYGGKGVRLAALNKLSNRDKHRLPHVTLAVPETITFYTTDPLGSPDIEIEWGAIEGRTVIARYRPFGRGYTEMDMQRLPTFTIGLGSPGSSPSQRRIETALPVARYFWPISPFGECSELTFLTLLSSATDLSCSSRLHLLQLSPYPATA